MAELTAKIVLEGVDKASPAIQKVSKRFDAATKSMVRSNQQLSGSFGRMQGSASGLFRSLTRITALVTGGGIGIAAAKIFKAGLGFDQAIANLSSETGIAGQNLALLKNRALEFSNASGKPVEEVVAAFADLSNQMPEIGDNAQALSMVTKEAILLSKATGMDLTDAVRISTSVIKQFGGSADQANHFVNVLASGAGDVNKTADALLKVGVAAKQSGLTIEQTTAMVQALAKAGISGGEGGTALESVLNRLQKLGNKKFNPSVVGMGKALDNLGKANLTTAQRIKIFGLQNQAAADILIRSRGEIQQTSHELLNASAAEQKAAARREGAASRINEIFNRLRNVGITVFDKLGKHLDPLISKMEKWAESFDAEAFAARIGNAADSVSQFVEKMGGIEGVANKAKLAVEAFLVFKGLQLVMPLAASIGTLAASFGAAGASAAGAAGGVSALSASLSGLAIAAAGLGGFIGTFKLLKALGPNVSEEIGMLNPVSAPISAFKKVRRQLGSMSSVPEETGIGRRMMDIASGNLSGAGQSIGSGMSENLAPRLQSLANEIAGQQSTLKKPQQIDLRINISSPVPTEVTSIKGSPGLAIKANTGQMKP